MESLDFNITHEYASYLKTKEHLHARIVPKMKMEVCPTPQIFNNHIEITHFDKINSTHFARNK